MTNPSLNCLSEGQGATTITTHPILPSRNEDYGFFRTLTVCPQRDRCSAEVWTLASRLIAEAIYADSEDEMIRRWQDWRISRKTERCDGIPAGLPYLTGWVQHFAVAAAMVETD